MRGQIDDLITTGSQQIPTYKSPSLPLHFYCVFTVPETSFQKQEECRHKPIQQNKICYSVAHSENVTIIRFRLFEGTERFRSAHDC